MLKPKKKKTSPSGPEKEFKELSERNTASGLETEEYFDSEDAFSKADSEGMIRPDGSAMPAGAFSLEELDRMYGGLDLDEEELRPFALGQGHDASRVGSRAGEERAVRARQALLSGADGVEPARRAELLMLLEDLGMAGLQPPPEMPVEKHVRTVKPLIEEELSKQLMTTRNYMDAVALRESSILADGSYFAYLLNTRRVAKVGPEGKRQSVSCLVVVGNGKGTAGVGMGKDISAGNALYKATLAARKNFIHIDRFDNRTLFHAVGEHNNAPWHERKAACGSVQD